MCVFEDDFIFLFGERMKEDEDFCKDVYSALTNVTWMHGFGGGGTEVCFTYRAAGDFISKVIGKGDYMDWYLCAGEGDVSSDIEQQMLNYGWKYYEYS